MIAGFEDGKEPQPRNSDNFLKREKAGSSLFPRASRRNTALLRL